MRCHYHVVLPRNVNDHDGLLPGAMDSSVESEMEVVKIKDSCSQTEIIMYKWRFHAAP